MRIESTSDSPDTIKAVLEGRGGVKPVEITGAGGETDTAIPGKDSYQELQPEAAGDDEPEAAAKPNDKPAGEKPKSRFQQRIDEITKREGEKTRQAQARAAQLEEELRQIRAKAETVVEAAPKKTAPPAATEADATDPEPKFEDDEYESVVDWQRAHAQWTIRFAARAADTKIAEERDRVTRAAATSEANAAFNARQERIAKFAEAHPDYDAVVDGLPHVPGILAALDNAAGDEDAEIYYELAKDRRKFDEIAAASPVQQLVKMGEVIASVRAARGTPRRPSARTTEIPASAAPAPSSQNGRGRASGTVPQPFAVAGSAGNMSEYKRSRGR